MGKEKMLKLSTNQVYAIKHCPPIAHPQQNNVQFHSGMFLKKY
jgi:hypothetical protein